jgi:hypothetical protein
MASIEYSTVVGAGPGWTTVTTPEGRELTIQGDRATRNNNPGNLEYHDWQDAYGALGHDGRFAVFSTREGGIQAMAALTFGSSKYSDLTLAEAIAEYAPSFENNTKAYASSVSRAAGVSLDTKMKDVPTGKRADVMNAMMAVEGNRPAKAYDAKTGKLVATVDPRYTATPKTVQAPTSRTASNNAAAVAEAGPSMQSAGLLGIDGRPAVQGLGSAYAELAQGLAAAGQRGIGGLGASPSRPDNMAFAGPDISAMNVNSRVAQAFAPQQDIASSRVAMAHASPPPMVSAPASRQTVSDLASSRVAQAHATPVSLSDRANSRVAQAHAPAPSLASRGPVGPAPAQPPSTASLAAAYSQMGQGLAQAGVLGLDGRSSLFHAAPESVHEAAEEFLATSNPVAKPTPANVPTPTAAPRGLGVPTPTPAPRGLAAAIPTPTPAPRGLPPAPATAARPAPVIEQGDGLGYRETPPPPPSTDYLGQGSKALDAVFSGAPAGSFARSTGPNVASFENLGNGMVAKTDVWGNVSYSRASEGLAGAGGSGTLGGLFGRSGHTIEAEDEGQDGRADRERGTGWGLGSGLFAEPTTRTGAAVRGGLGTALGGLAGAAVLGGPMGGIVGGLVGREIAMGRNPFDGRNQSSLTAALDRATGRTTARATGYGVDEFPAAPPAPMFSGWFNGITGGWNGGGGASLSPAADAAISAGRGGLY